MHIVCCLKQVPDTADVKIDSQTNTLIREGVESIMNPYDLVAVETAVRLKEKHECLISAVCMGPAQAESILRQALSLGVDKGILLSDRAFAGADTLATSYTLAQAVSMLDRQHQVDLIICGKQAIDGDTAQTGPGLATRLGFALLTYITGLESFKPSQRKIIVRRKVEEGQEVLEVNLPALITVELDLARPRRASLPGLMKSLRRKIEVWDKNAIEADAEQLGIKGSPTWVRRIGVPSPRAGGPTFNAAEGLQDAVDRSLDILFQDFFTADEPGVAEGEEHGKKFQGN